jgi:dihydrofolate synthase/folylpolyglutamate synthase
VLDVAHNAAAAENLVANLDAARGAGRTVAVFGALKDKDTAAIVRAVAPAVDEWLLVDSPGSRGMSAAELAERAFGAVAAKVSTIGALDAALQAAAARSRSGDRVVVFGSFHVVGPALEWLRLYSRPPKND